MGQILLVLIECNKGHNANLFCKESKPLKRIFFLFLIAYSYFIGFLLDWADNKFFELNCIKMSATLGSTRFRCAQCTGSHAIINRSNNKVS